MPLDSIPACPPSGASRTLAGRAWASGATLAAPFLRVMLRQRAARGKEIADRLPEREGVATAARPAGKLLWLHAASVGEAVSVLPVVQALPAPISVLFTSGTVTSARLLSQRLVELNLQDRVVHQFMPLDVPAWCDRFLDHWQPDAAGFTESELWPNALRACAARAIPTVLLNGRMSVRSAARWCNLPGFAAETMGHFTWIAAQSDADGRRLSSLGGRTVDAPGNLKFAAPPLDADASELARLQPLVATLPRWMAASTHPGDETRAAAIHRRLISIFPGLLTVIVPRHPERGAAIAAELGGVPRRALGQDPAPGLWLADTLGELGLMYRLFPTVLMGKSFPPGGGQNPLEPARLGCAIACGPAMQNFTDAVAALSAEGGLSIVDSESAAAAWVQAMLIDDTARTTAGLAAARAANQQAELPARMAARLAALMQ